MTTLESAASRGALKRRAGRLIALKAAFPDGAVIGVPGAALSLGGGVPYRITQQMLARRAVPAR